MSRFCPNGHEVGDKTRFCPKCGEEILESIKKFCPKCGKERKGQELFCANCGTNFHQQLDTLNNGSYVNGNNNVSRKKYHIYALVLIVVCLAIGGFLFSRHNTSKISPVEKQEQRVKMKDSEDQDRQREQERLRQRELEIQQEEKMRMEEQKMEEIERQILSYKYQISELEDEAATICLSFSLSAADANPMMETGLRRSRAEIMIQGEKLYDNCGKLLMAAGYSNEAQEIYREKKEFMERIYIMFDRALSTY